MFQVKNSQHNRSHRESVVSLLVLDGNLFDMKKVKKTVFVDSSDQPRFSFLTIGGRAGRVEQLHGEVHCCEEENGLNTLCKDV